MTTNEFLDSIFKVNVFILSGYLILQVIIYSSIASKFWHVFSKLLYMHAMPAINQLLKRTLISQDLCVQKSKRNFL